MPTLLASVQRLLADPPPEFVFEIAPDVVRMARTAEPQTIVSHPLPPGILSPSPLHDNVVLPEPLNEAIARLLPPGKNGKRRTAAVLLPDHCAHVTVLDFDGFPEKPEEQSSLIRFRLKRSVPFDVETAALSYWVQGIPARKSLVKVGGAAVKTRREVVVAVTALEIVSRYEAPFRVAGIHPGFVSLAPLACLDLFNNEGVTAVARLSGPILTMMATADGVLKVIRSLELADISLKEITSHLHQTFVYIEDMLGASPARLLLAGFGDFEAEAVRDLPAEFQVPVDVLGGADTAIRGYLKSFIKGAAAA